MNSYRGPASRGSKATATTVCQKCLAKGHYSYECKATAQERPYASRPSRTQQLLNPKLAPKLTTDTPSEFTRKKGVADEILSKNTHQRRSRSSSLFSSVSTISTNRSRSRDRRTQNLQGQASDMDIYFSQRSPEPAVGRGGQKRARESSSSSALSSDSESSPERAGRRRSPDRATRSRRGLTSPEERGRRRNRSVRHKERPRRARSDSLSSDGAGHRKEDIRPRKGKSGANRHGHNDFARSPSSPPPNGNSQGSRKPRRERSLSPFSKRLALTQAMNLNR